MHVVRICCFSQSSTLVVISQLCSWDIFIKHSRSGRVGGTVGSNVGVNVGSYVGLSLGGDVGDVVGGVDGDGEGL